MEVAILGGGIGGLVAALFLHREGVPCRVYEATTEYKPLGVGLNLFSHAVSTLTDLGLGDALAKSGFEPASFLYLNQYGQEIYSEPCGRHAGFDFPHYSIHRASLHSLLHDAVIARLGADSIVMGRRVKRLDQDADGVTVFFEDLQGKETIQPLKASVAIGCDGIHSAVRRQFYPAEGGPTFGGIYMWRGVTRGKPVLGGNQIIRAGPLRTGKLLVYPLHNYDDGTQLLNWVVEKQSEVCELVDWSKPGKLEDFLPWFKDWTYDWLDVPELFKKASMILEYPMVDRDPIPQWSFGRITLLGDAAHPMYPRGGNGAAQSIIDASVLAPLLKKYGNDPVQALQVYELERRAKTTKIVNTNRSQPPDFIIESVDKLSQGKPFAHIDDLISKEEMNTIVENYRAVTGATLSAVNKV